MFYRREKWRIFLNLFILYILFCIFFNYNDAIDLGQWKVLFRNIHAKPLIVLDSEGANDGFGGRLEHLHNGISTLLNLGLDFFEFGGFPPHISQQSVYMPRKSNNKYVFCHSIQDFEETRSMFRYLWNLQGHHENYINVDLDPKYIAQDLLYLINEEHNKQHPLVRNWVSSLRCDSIDFDSIHNLPIYYNFTKTIFNLPCELDLRSHPSASNFGHCKYLTYVLGKVEAGLLSQETDLKASQYFNFSSLSSFSDCAFSKTALNVAIHVRMGDRSGNWGDGQGRHRGFQQLVDMVVAKLSRNWDSDHPIQIHIMTEIKTPCTDITGKSLPDLPSIEVEEKFTCEETCLLKELIPNATCSKQYPFVIRGMHRVAIGGENPENTAHIFQGKIDPTTKELHIPVLVHGSGNSIAADFFCLVSSDVLLPGCSRFSNFATFFTEGVVLHQSCRDGQPTGRLVDELFYNSEKWQKLISQRFK